MPHLGVKPWACLLPAPSTHISPSLVASPPHLRCVCLSLQLVLDQFSCSKQPLQDSGQPMGTFQAPVTLHTPSACKHSAVTPHCPQGHSKPLSSLSLLRPLVFSPKHLPRLDGWSLPAPFSPGGSASWAHHPASWKNQPLMLLIPTTCELVHRCWLPLPGQSSNPSRAQKRCLGCGF